MDAFLSSWARATSSTAVRPNGRPRWRSDAIHANLTTGDAADGGGGARWVRWPTERVERGGGRALSRAFPMGDRWRWAEDPRAAAVPFRRIRRSPAAAAAALVCSMFTEISQVVSHPLFILVFCKVLRSVLTEKLRVWGCCLAARLTDQRLDPALLFNIVSDVLATLWKTASEKGQNEGLVPELVEGGLTHLQWHYFISRT